MKNFLSFLLCFSCLIGFSQTTPLTVTTIAKAQPDFPYTPGRGPETWNGFNQVNVPVNGTSTVPAQDYIRYCWYQVQSQSATAAGASMIYTQIDNDFHAAITGGRTIRLGFLVNFGDNVPANVGGSRCVYPLALHNLMQAEAVKDHNDGSYWNENPNSANWLTWLTAMMNNVANHINTTSFNGVPYSSVFKAMDLRICGAFGEGAVNNGEPLGTVAGLNAIVDAYKAAFPNVFLEGMIGNFSGGQPGPTGLGFTPEITSTYILSTSNAKGLIGVRRDNWGNNASYIRMWTDQNPNVHGFRYDTTIQNRWKYAPVTGEPENSGTDMSDLMAEVTRAPFPTRIGNGNYSNTSAALSNNMRAAYLAMGYRWQVASGNASTTFINGTVSNVTMSLVNNGSTPSYDHWTQVFDLRDPAGNLIATWNGTFDPYLVIPGTYSSSTNFTLTAIPAATNYNLFVTFKDALGYMKPMPLANTAQQTNGSYLIRSNITVANGGGGTTPIANAGVDQSLNLPTNSVLLNASGSVAATAYHWTLITGPNVPTIISANNVSTAVNGLIAGTYVFQVQINATGPTDQVVVTVTGAPVVAFAGIDQTVTTPPTTTVTLTGAGSTGTITAYAWTKVSGPAGGLITSPGNVSTTITALQVGTYIYQLAVNGTASTDQVSIIVNGVTPVANAGPDQQILLPANQVTLTAAASTGAPTSYVWALISGPNTPTITCNTCVTTTVTAMVQGHYIFSVTVNGGSADQVIIDVNAVTISAGTIYGNTGPVARPTSYDGRALELGTKFRSAIAGYITGVRFYKTAGNTGTHIGQLYSRTGVLLASGTFAGESTTGWQVLQFAKPVLIAAGTTYIAAYFSPSGRYVFTAQGFRNAVVNGNLTGLRDGTDGHNGVYRYTNTPAFPNVYSALNNRPTYWVDAIFSPLAPPQVDVPGELFISFPLYFVIGRH